MNAINYIGLSTIFLLFSNITIVITNLGIQAIPTNNSMMMIDSNILIRMILNSASAAGTIYVNITGSTKCYIAKSVSN